VSRGHRNLGKIENKLEKRIQKVREFQIRTPAYGFSGGDKETRVGQVLGVIKKKKKIYTAAAATRIGKVAWTKKELRLSDAPVKTELSMSVQSGQKAVPGETKPNQETFTWDNEGTARRALRIKANKGPRHIRGRNEKTPSSWANGDKGRSRKNVGKNGGGPPKRH